VQGVQQGARGAGGANGGGRRGARAHRLVGLYQRAPRQRRAAAPHGPFLRRRGGRGGRLQGRVHVRPPRGAGRELPAGQDGAASAAAVPQPPPPAAGAADVLLQPVLLAAGGELRRPDPGDPEVLQGGAGGLRADDVGAQPVPRDRAQHRPQRRRRLRGDLVGGDAVVGVAPVPARARRPAPARRRLLEVLKPGRAIGGRGRPPAPITWFG
jgi:hypothetical protein